MDWVPVFDLGNVLVFVDEDRFLERLAARSRPGVRVAEVFAEHARALAIDLGGDFGALHPLLVRDLGLTMTREELRLAWCDIFRPNPPMLEVVAETPRPRCLLSNTNEPHITWLRERYPELFTPFAWRFFSYEMGLRKPDPAVFRRVQEETGAPAGRHVLVDDLVMNVAAAEEAGWRGVRFAGPEDCRRRLAALMCG